MAAQTKFGTLSAQGSIKAKLDGIKISDSYVSNTNCLVPLENSTHAADVHLNFNTIIPGSTGSVMVPNHYKLISHAYIEVVLTGHRNTTVGYLGNAAGAHPFTQNIVAPSLFQEIGYQLPGCERAVFKPGSVLLQAIDSCGPSQKRTNLVELMGNGDSIGDWYDKFDAGDVVVTKRVFMPVPLPNFSFSTEQYKAPKDLPVHLLGESFQIFAKFANPEDYLKQNAYNETGYTIVTGFVYYSWAIAEAKVHIVYRQLAAAPEYKTVVAKMPFQMIYSQVVPVTRRNSNTQYHVNLPGVRQGETTQFIIRLSNINVKKNLEGYRIENIYLNFGGYNLWVAPENTVDYYDHLHNEASGYIDYLRQEAYKSDWATNARVFYYHIPLARMLAHIRGIHNYGLGVDFNNAEVKLSFSVHSSDYAKLESDMALHVDQYLTSVLQFNGQTATLIQ